MSWQNEMGTCPNCKKIIQAKDFITDTHNCDVVR